MGSGFSGNAYTAHGRLREPEIAAWVAATHGILPSSALFHAVVEKRHLATPDGIGVYARRPRPAVRDQDDEQVVAQHPALLSASGVVAAARARRRAHAGRVGGARRLRPRRRRAAMRVGRARRGRDREARASRDGADRRAAPAHDRWPAAHVERLPAAAPIRASRSAPSPSPTDPRAPSPRRRVALRAVTSRERARRRSVDASSTHIVDSSQRIDYS